MAVLLFLVPRNDCRDGLVINPTDPIYRSAVDKAWRSGVKIRAFSLQYNIDGSIQADKEVAVIV